MIRNTDGGLYVSGRIVFGALDRRTEHKAVPVPIPPDMLDCVSRIRDFARGLTLEDARLFHGLIASLEDFTFRHVLTLAMGMTAAGSITDARSPTSAGAKVPDSWLKPKEAAAAMGYSEKWLRRRHRKPPYSTFCIPIDGGRSGAFRVSRRGLEEHMERERRRAARE